LAFLVLPVFFYGWCGFFSSQPGNNPAGSYRAQSAYGVLLMTGGGSRLQGKDVSAVFCCVWSMVRPKVLLAFAT